MQEHTRKVEVPEMLGTDIVAVPAGAPVDIELRLESVTEGVLSLIHI